MALVSDGKAECAFPEEVCFVERKCATLKDTDILSRRNVSRRTMLQTLGVGAAVTALAAGTVIAQTQPKRRDPCRDSDHGPSDQDGCGRPPTS